MSYKKCSNKHILPLFTREPSLGLTPFMEAAAEGHEIIVQLFLQHVSTSRLILLCVIKISMQCIYRIPVPCNAGTVNV